MKQYISNIKTNYNKIKYFDNFICEFARKLHIQYQYKIYIDGKFTLNVYSDTDLENTIYKNIICKWCKYFFKNYKINEKLILYIGLFDNKRLFTDDIVNKDLIPKEQINGGVTYKFFSEKKIEVYIYRKEEFERLLIHEFIHAFNLDKHYMTFGDDKIGGGINTQQLFVKLFIDDIFELKSDKIILYPYFFEIYTQSYSIYLLSKFEKININDFYEHLLPICNKIINYHNHIGYYKEETSILGYFFGVCYLLCNWNKFENYIDKNQYNTNEFILLLEEGKQIFMKKMCKKQFKLNDSLKLTPT